MTGVDHKCKVTHRKKDVSQDNVISSTQEHGALQVDGGARSRILVLAENNYYPAKFLITINIGDLCYLGVYLIFA